MRYLVITAAFMTILAGCQPAAPSAPMGQGQSPAASPAAGAPPAGSPGGRGKNAVVSVQAETVKFGPLTVSNTTGGTVVADSQSLVAAQTVGTVKTLDRKRPSTS